MGDQATLATQQEAVAALKHSIPGEIAQAVASIETESATLKLLGDQTPAADVEQATTVDYQAGRVRLLDKVNLETDIVRQRQLRLASQIRLSLALAALDHALGRGSSGAPQPRLELKDHVQPRRTALPAHLPSGAASAAQLFSRLLAIVFPEPPARGGRGDLLFFLLRHG